MLDTSAEDAATLRLLAEIVPTMLQAMRRSKVHFRPSEMTAMKVALQKIGPKTELHTRISGMLQETPLEREERRETPRKPG